MEYPSYVKLDARHVEKAAIVRLAQIRSVRQEMRNAEIADAVVRRIKANNRKVQLWGWWPGPLDLMATSPDVIEQLSSTNSWFAFIDRTHSFEYRTCTRLINACQIAQTSAGDGFVLLSDVHVHSIFGALE